MRSLKKGIFITFEGGEGSGKSTQSRALSRWLEQKGHKVRLTREPGGTPLADRIRQELLHSKAGSLTPDQELFLYEVARRDHVEEVIRPSLNKGYIVICDRFTDATLAYQGYARGLPISKIEKLNHAATGGLNPKLTFLFDLPVEAGMKRVRKRGKKLDRLESESLRFHNKVRQGYLTLARKEKKRFRILNASLSRKTVFASLCREVAKIL